METFAGSTPQTYKKKRRKKLSGAMMPQTYLVLQQLSSIPAIWRLDNIFQKCVRESNETQVNSNEVNRNWKKAFRGWVIVSINLLINVQKRMTQLNYHKSYSLQITCPLPSFFFPRILSIFIDQKVNDS